MTEIEEIQYAKSFIDSLARGVNPLNGEPVPDGEVVNNVRISRCLYFVSNVLDKLCRGEYAAKGKKAKAPFVIRNGELEKFPYSDGGITISDIIERINNIIGYDGRKIKRSVIIDWLIADGFMSVNEINGRKYKSPTDKGMEAGIFTEERLGYNGSYRAVLYGKDAQRMIIGHLAEIGAADGVQPTGENEPDSNRGKSWDGKQEAELIEMFKDGLTVNAIAKAMKRSQGAIRARLIKLGLINDTGDIG